MTRRPSATILDCIGNTPLVPLRRMTAPNGARILLKIESQNPTGSMKDRMALAMIDAAERSGRLMAGGQVVEYTGGSTGVSLALVCAVKGYPLHIVTSDAFAREKLDHMRLLGARLTIIKFESGRMTEKLTKDMVEAARVIAGETGAYWTDQLKNMDQLCAYHALADEIWDQTGGRLDAFVQMVGTAASLRGAAEGLVGRGPAIRILAVEPAESPVLSGGTTGAHKIDGVGAGFVVPLWREGIANEIERVSTEEARAMALRLAREEGLFCGTSTGGNVVAALRLAERLPRGATIVTIMCGYGDEVPKVPWCGALARLSTGRAPRRALVLSRLRSRRSRFVAGAVSSYAAVTEIHWGGAVTGSTVAQVNQPALAIVICAALALPCTARAQQPPPSQTAQAAQKKRPAVPPLPAKAPPAPVQPPPIAKPAPTVPPPAAHGHAPPSMMAPSPDPPTPVAGHMGHGAMTHHAAAGVLGAYPASRDASGTSWQPDALPHTGMHAMASGWSLMGHVNLTLVHDRQSGPRGEDKTFPAGMIMGAARRDFGPGTLHLRAMLSPEPFMGKRGYPLLLAAGETADGATTLVDRQHPHDLLMELAGSYSLRLADGVSVFVYGGDPAEPALGPPAFMHRASGAGIPAPITHHWLDSTHIVFGAVTAGLVASDFKFEVSQFTGREPDEKRFDFDRTRFDSTSARISWNPGANWSFQISGGRLNSPEALSPGEDETRWTASVIYVRPIGEDQAFAFTLAGGLKQYEGGDDLGGALAEASYRIGNFTFFGRGEWVENHDLNPGTVEEIGAGSLGGVYDIPLVPHVKIGVGGVATRPFLDNATGAFEASYGASPHGEMAFVRLVLD